MATNEELEELLGFRVRPATIYEEMTLGATHMLVTPTGTIREALQSEAAMWDLLRKPQTEWGA